MLDLPEQQLLTFAACFPAQDTGRACFGHKRLGRRNQNPGCASGRVFCVGHRSVSICSGTGQRQAFIFPALCKGWFSKICGPWRRWLILEIEGSFEEQWGS